MQTKILVTGSSGFLGQYLVQFLAEKDFSNACFHLCPILIDFEDLRIDKKLFFEELIKAGLNLQVHYIPVYWHPYYANLGYQRGLCPNAEEYYRRTISLPLYPDLTDEDVNEIVSRFSGVLNKCANLV